MLERRSMKTCFCHIIGKEKQLWENRSFLWQKKTCTYSNLERISSLNPVARHNSGISKITASCPARLLRSVDCEAKSGWCWSLMRILYFWKQTFHFNKIRTQFTSILPWNSSQRKKSPIHHVTGISYSETDRNKHHQFDMFCCYSPSVQSSL